MSRTEPELLVDSLAHLELLLDHAQGGATSQVVIDAICMRLSAALEVLNHLDSSTRERIFGASWPLMWGMRNRIAHGYLLIDQSIILRTVLVDVPPIIAAIKAELATRR